jgi:hypothetical protein
MEACRFTLPGSRPTEPKIAPAAVSFSSTDLRRGGSFSGWAHSWPATEGHLFPKIAMLLECKSGAGCTR